VHLPDILTRLTEPASPDQPLYLVGGAVRDFLLGQPCKDYDLVGPGDVRGIARQFANQVGGAFYILDEQRNTCRVLVDQSEGSRTIIDFSVLRGNSIIDDLAERDFTINAMAVDLRNPDTIIDPYKGGRDLQEKWLRPVNHTSLQDDPLRTIRGIRYAVALGLKVEPPTTKLIDKAVPELSRISTERKRDELFKILDGEKVHVALQLLHHFQVFEGLPLRVRLGFIEALDQSRALGEMIGAITTTSPTQKQAAFHSTSLMLVFGQFKPAIQDHFFRVNSSGRSRRALLHLCVLLDGSSGYSKKEIQDILALSVDEAEVIDAHIRYREYCDQVISGDSPSALEIYRFFKATGSTGIDLVFSSLAGYRARIGAEQQQQEWLNRLGNAGQLVKSWFTQPELISPLPLLNGDEIIDQLDLAPGPRIGDLLETLISAQVEGKIKSKNDALEWLKNQEG